MRPTAYTELRRQAPRLALALLFQTEEQKQQLSFLLLFGLELDRLSAQASEPMLALIRLKWWEDQLEARTDEAGPLAGYLHQQMAAGHLDKADVARLITSGQRRFRPVRQTNLKIGQSWSVSWLVRLASGNLICRNRLAGQSPKAGPVSPLTRSPQPVTFTRFAGGGLNF